MVVKPAKISKHEIRRQAKEDAEQKVFEEIQNKYITSETEMAAFQIKAREAESEIKKMALVEEELKTLEDDAIIYQKYGRAFILSSKEGALRKNQSDIDKKKGDKTRFDTLAKAFEVQLNEATNALKEVKISKPVLTGSVGGK